jgi:hypothetical protein
MDRRAPIAAVLACLVAVAGVGVHRHAAAAAPLPPIPTWQAVAPADKAWIEASIAQARPEAATLIRHAIGRVTFRTAYAPDAPWAGLTQPYGHGYYAVTLNLSFLDSQRGAGLRDDVVLHELGHVVDFAEVPDDVVARLAAEVPATGTCLTADTGDCTSPRERFADTFAKWALRGAVSVAGAGYGIPAPPSLEDWGAPLGALAARIAATT